MAHTARHIPVRLGVCTAREPDLILRADLLGPLAARIVILVRLHRAYKCILRIDGGGSDRGDGPCDGGGRGFRRGAGRAPGLLPGGYGVTLPVCGYYDIPVEVSSVDLRASILESAQGLAGRVAVDVVFPNLNDATRRGNPAQESRA